MKGSRAERVLGGTVLGLWVILRRGESRCKFNLDSLLDFVAIGQRRDSFQGAMPVCVV